ncbi:MAG: NADH-quinone oxidoreductase subunit N [Nitrospinota bacterium]|nr:NADH-quinone oxidoreductase subunit N [Nitrospinota bacterium]
MQQVVIPEILFSLAAPEISLAILIGIVLIFDLFVSLEKKSLVGSVSFIGIVVVLYFTLSQWDVGPKSTFSDFYIVDNFSVFLKSTILVCAALTVLMSIEYLKVEKINFGEFYSMLLFSVFGMLVLVSANDLMTLYLGIETMSISIYVLVAFMRNDVLSREAGLKYFLMGAFASGILLYGIALLYGYTGSTSFTTIAKFLSNSNVNSVVSQPILILSVILLVGGFAFKMALAPFHMWLPDAYTGAPTSVTGFMSVAVKAAAVAVMVRLFIIVLPSMSPRWSVLFWILTAATMIWGNVAAIAQKSLKRMLAYSSMSHAGYILMGFVSCFSISNGKYVFSDFNVSAVLFYLGVYLFTNLGAFGMLIWMCQEKNRGDQIEDWRGLGQSHPWFGMCFVVFLLSLAGIPPTAGFVGKLYLFAAAIQNEFYWLAVIGILTSAISMYYYGRVIMVMFMEPAKEPDIPFQFSRASSLLCTLLILLAFTLFLGIFPDSFINITKISASSLI